MNEIEEAMDAGYAQGCEATEARAIKRIDALESELKDLRDGKCRCWQESGSPEKSHAEHCVEQAERLIGGYCLRIRELKKNLEAAQPVIDSVRKYFAFTGAPANMLKALNEYDEATKS